MLQSFLCALLRKTTDDLVIADFYRVNGERVSQKGDIDEDAVLSKKNFPTI